MQIGPYTFPSPTLALAPMAGVTDRPFRVLCKRLGADMAATEMTTSDPSLWRTKKSVLRREHVGEPSPIIVQIAGYDPAMMAEAARFNVDEGAQIIDINMGCPAKKVCHVLAGSALLKDEALVGRILEAVVRAVPVPVTLKTRTGWSPEQRNGVRIARIAEESGIAALAVHGRTRCDFYEGAAEYDTLAEIRAAIRIPLLANGDIVDAAQARAVLKHTGADGVMLGRAAQGRPWVFRELRAALRGEAVEVPDAAQQRAILVEHLQALYAFYGEAHGVRVARKHIGWYLRAHPALAEVRERVNAATDARTQLAALAAL